MEVLTLSRPDARNAINPELASALERALDDVESSPEIWAVVLTGKGSAFCAGADLKEIARGNVAQLDTRRGGFAGFVRREFSKPIIAAVNGHALAGGFEIVLACDLVVAADTASFGLPEARRGLVAAAGGPIRLARRIPAALALEIVMTGRPLSAQRALELGLVNRVVPRASVLNEALDLAREIEANSPSAVRAGRHLVHRAIGLSDDAAFSLAAQLLKDLTAHGDVLEGARAFTEKRDPVWPTPV